VTELYEFMSSSPWLTSFIGCLCVLAVETLFDLVFRLVNSPLRHWNIRKHGYPPLHCDADGDSTNTADLDKIRKLLYDDRFDSKDWKAGDAVERVEWLLSMYRSAREQEQLAWDMLAKVREEEDA